MTAPAGDSAIDTVLDRIGVLAGRPRTVRDLGGGLTNTNLRVTTEDADYVVRVSANTTGFLGIDREAEHANSVRAHSAGVGAEVVDYLPDDNILVLRFIPGRTLAVDDVISRTDRLAAAMRLLHGGPTFVSDFDMRVIRRRYLEVVLDEGFRIPPDYLDLATTFERLEDALGQQPEARVPCNNDLLAANFIDDGDRIWIIDYEYSGQNEASFEIGNLASENGLDEAHTAALTSAYWGMDDDAKVARALAWALLARYGWTLWAAIQAAVSTLDFDFWSWGMTKYVVAREAALDGSVDKLIARLGA
jgi:thiamine kinase-like enzyme